MVRRTSLALLALAACTTIPAEPLPEVTSRVQRFYLPIYAARQLDVLFVIDNSPAMAPHRERLVANLGAFIDVLSTVQGGQPSVHLGVVTTDVAEGGRMRTSERVDGAFVADLRYESTDRFPNYEGALRDVFAEIGDVGSDGDVYARPLDTVRLALEHPANAGFVRDEAMLAIVVITATDDCSPTTAFAPTATTDPAVAAAHCYVHREALSDVAAIAEAVKARKHDPYSVAVSLIAGPDGPVALTGEGGAATPSCSDELGGATAAPRLHALLDQFPNRGLFTSICQPNLSDGLALFAQLAYRSIGSPCVELPLLDLEPSIEGVQAECSVVDHVPDGTERLIPACDGGSERCWSVVPDALNCPLGPMQRFHVTPLSEPFPSRLTVIGECVSA